MPRCRCVLACASARSASRTSAGRPGWASRTSATSTDMATASARLGWADYSTGKASPQAACPSLCHGPREPLSSHCLAAMALLDCLSPRPIARSARPRLAAAVSRRSVQGVVRPRYARRRLVSRADGGQEIAMQPSAAVQRTSRPLTRPMALGSHGVVATGHALASQVGLRVLQEGGNAVDAALAAGAVSTVVLPEANTIGGDLFALVHDGRTGEVIALNSSGPGPAAATADWFRQQGHTTVPARGVLSVEVPGLVDGWALLHERFATRPLAE